MPQKLPLEELTIARIRGLRLTAEKVDRAVQLLAKAPKDAVPGTVGAGVSLLDSRGRQTSSGSTDRVVQQADALQYEPGECPCLTADTARLLELIAAPAATPLSDIHSTEAPHRISEGLQASLYSRDLVDRACGILMERHGLGHENALRTLMRQARAANTTLRQVNEDLVAGIPAARD